MIAQFARCTACGGFLRTGRHSRQCAAMRAVYREQALSRADRAHAEPPHGRAHRGRKRNSWVRAGRLVAGLPTARREHGVTYVLPDDDSNGVYALYERPTRPRAEKPSRSTARERRTRQRAAARATVPIAPMVDARSTEALIDAGIIPAVNRAQSQFD